MFNLISSHLLWSKRTVLTSHKLQSLINAPLWCHCRNKMLLHVVWFPQLWQEPWWSSDMIDNKNPSRVTDALMCLWSWTWPLLLHVLSEQDHMFFKKLRQGDFNFLLSFWPKSPLFFNTHTLSHTHTHIVIFRVTNTQIHPPYVRGTSLMEHFLHSTWWLNTLFGSDKCSGLCLHMRVLLRVCVDVCVCVFSCLSHVAQLN